MPRTIDPTGGLISNIRDQPTYLRLHLGDGRGPDGARILSRSSLRAMRSNPSTGGDWDGQHSGFLFVPERDFGLTALSRFGGLHNLPAVPHALTAENRGLRMRHLTETGDPLDPPPGAPASLAFYRDDHVLLMNGDGKPIGPRANFVRARAATSRGSATAAGSTGRWSSPALTPSGRCPRRRARS